MRVFAKEIELGLQEKILSNKVVASVSPVKPLTDTTILAEVQEAYAAYASTDAGKSYASYNDLYWIESVLVSSVMNKNDDYFAPAEMWSSRHTPDHKPTNIGHSMDYICGHMMRSWMLTGSKSKVIPDNRAAKDLPNLIHLAVAGVIYRDLNCFYQDAINKLILRIEANEMAVSMEAHFEDFDYALLDEKTGVVKQVERNDETSWMSGLLRWWGGDGVYTVKKDGKIEQVYRIGRWLKGITFTGKGYVDNPANPDSIILTKSFEPLSAASVHEAAGVSRKSAKVITIGNINKKGNSTMPNEIDYREFARVEAKALRVDELEKERDKLQAKLDKALETLDKNKDTIANFEFGKKEYEAVIESHRKEIEVAKAEKEELMKQIEAAKKSKEEDEKAKKEKAEVIEKLEKELAELKAAQQTAARIATLLEGGLDSKEAEAQVKIYASFSDEQFKSMAATVINSHKTVAALKELEKNGKISAETLEQMQIKPEGDETQAKKDEDKKDEDEKAKKKAKSGSVFAEMAGSTPMVGSKS